MTARPTADAWLALPKEVRDREIDAHRRAAAEQRHRLRSLKIDHPTEASDPNCPKAVGPSKAVNSQFRSLRSDLAEPPLYTSTFSVGARLIRTGSELRPWLLRPSLPRVISLREGGLRMVVRSFFLSFDLVGNLVVEPVDEPTRRWAEENVLLQWPLVEAREYVSARRVTWTQDTQGLRRAATLLAHVVGSVFPLESFVFDYRGKLDLVSVGCARRAQLFENPV